MIQGNVIGLEAQVKIVLCLPNQRRVQIECVVDTGFAGALTLPPAIVAKLELPLTKAVNAIPKGGCTKSGMSQKKFYKALIDKADQRFDQHLKKLKEDSQRQHLKKNSINSPLNVEPKSKPEPINSWQKNFHCEICVWLVN